MKKSAKSSVFPLLMCLFPALFTSTASARFYETRTKSETTEQFCKTVHLCPNIAARVPIPPLPGPTPGRNPTICWCNSVAPRFDLIYITDVKYIYADDINSYVFSVIRDGRTEGYLLSPDQSVTDSFNKNTNNLVIVGLTFTNSEVNPVIIKDIIPPDQSYQLQFSQSVLDWANRFKLGAPNYKFISPALPSF